MDAVSWLYTVRTYNLQRVRVQLIDIKNAICIVALPVAVALATGVNFTNRSENRKDFNVIKLLCECVSIEMGILN